MNDQQNLYTLAEASQLTGLSTEALRLRIKRGSLNAEKGNDGHPRVRLTSADLDGFRRQLGQRKPTLTRQDDDATNAIRVLEAAVGALREQADRERAATEAGLTAQRERAERAEARVGQVEREREEARVRAAAAEGEAKALRERAERAEGRVERLEADARRPWWRKLIG